VCRIPSLISQIILQELAPYRHLLRRVVEVSQGLSLHLSG